MDALDFEKTVGVSNERLISALKPPSPDMTSGQSMADDDPVQNNLVQIPFLNSPPPIAPSLLHRTDDCMTDLGTMGFDFNVPTLFEESDDIIDCNTDCYLPPPKPQDCIETDGLKSKPVVQKKKPIHPIKKRGDRYMPHFKASVVTFALENTIKDAALNFNVNQESVSYWVREALRHAPVQGEDQPKVLRKPTADLITWLKNCRIKSIVICRDSLIAKISQILETCTKEEVDKKDLWIYYYLERLHEKSSDEKSHIMYPDAFRHEVALHSRMCNNKKETINTFNICRKRLLTWLRVLDSDQKPCKRDLSQYVTSGKIDGEIWSWYKKQKVPPSSLEVRSMAVTLYRKAGFTKINCSHGWYYRWRARYALPPCRVDRFADDSEIIQWILTEFDQNRSVTHNDIVKQANATRQPNFNPSPSWIVRFLKRYTELLKYVPKFDTPFPPSMEREIEMFRSSCQKIIQDYGLTEANICAFDEIPLNFVSPGAVKKEALLRKSGFDNCQASLIVTCLASGVVLPTALIMKTPCEQNATPEFLKIIVQTKAINDEVTIKEWTDEILLPSFRATNQTNVLLICDSYMPHLYMKDSYNSEFVARGIKFMMIPGGCGPKLQPISMALSSLFESEIEEMWSKWCTEQSLIGSSLKFPDPSDILRWVDEIHYKIAINPDCQNEIRQSFIKAGYCVNPS